MKITEDEKDCLIDALMDVVDRHVDYFNQELLLDKFEKVIDKYALKN